MLFYIQNKILFDSQNTSIMIVNKKANLKNFKIKIDLKYFAELMTYTKNKLN